MYCKKAFLTAVLMFLGMAGCSAQLIINELMQSNIDCIMDDLNEFPDSWVELYNPGGTSENLNVYSIGMTDDASAAWKLPSQNVGPKGYVLIYCDKVGKGMHTDFRLETGKGNAVYIFKNGELVDKVENMKKQPAPNIAFGRETDGAEKWGFMLTPTPKASNAGGTTSNILGNPEFSVKGRVLTGTPRLRLVISQPEGTPEGTKIYYTTDGSEPTEKSIEYSGAIALSQTMTIRAKLICPGYLSPRSVVESYIFLGREQTLPVISIVTDDKYLNDNKIGIYSSSKYTDGDENFKHDWRRPINIEMYETDGTTCVFNQLCETRITGAATRTNPLKSLAVYANKRFGTKRFEYEFFPDQRPGQTNYKSFILRNAGNDFDYLYMRDAVIQRTVSANCDVDWQAWRPAIIYINGQYRGILNIRERSNDDNVYTNYDGLEDIDMFENWNELKAGTDDNLNAFKEFYNEHGHTMAEYAELMDVEEFINIMSANLFYANLDFPGNNIVMWRPRAEGGKWRWIMKDTDFGLGLYGRNVNYNTIEWIYNNGYDSGNAWGNTYDATRLFRRLMEDPDFNREFIDHCAIYMGDFLNERGTREQWDPMYDIIKTEYPKHRELFNPWWPNYNDELNNARTWVKNRPAYFYKYLADYYKLGTPTTFKINSSLKDSDLEGIGILFNGIRLTKGRFDGKFFQNREIRLSAVPGEQNTVVGWKITYNGSTQTINQCDYTFKMPICYSLAIEAIIGAADGIESVATDAKPRSGKMIIDGRLRIVHDGKKYNVDGTLVK